MCWVPLYTTKHKQRKQDMRPCKELEDKIGSIIVLGGTRNVNTHPWTKQKNTDLIKIRGELMRSRKQ